MIIFTMCSQDKEVSVVVPVYKVESYLSHCVDSILNQTYRNIEVFLVDDGSPDNCPALCDDYAAKDKRVKVIHKENGGLSDARNKGLEQATGDYVMFVDSDDFWVDENQLALLMKEVEANPQCDFIGFNVSYYFEATNRYVPWIAYDKCITDCTNKDELIVSLVKTGTFPISAWSKIIRKDFLIKNEVSFINGLLSEDIPWFLSLLEKAQDFRMLNQYVYAYRQVSNGTSITHNFSKRHFDNLFWIIRNGIETISQSNFSKQVKDSLLSFIAYELCILIGSLYKIEDKEWRSVRGRELRNYYWLFSYTDNPKVRKASFLRKIAGNSFMELTLEIFMKMKK